MALIKCFECGKEISDRAISCPHCGVPIATTNEKQKVDVKEEKTMAYDDDPQKRAALLLYLRDVRDLLLTQYMIRKKKKEEFNKIDNQIAEYKSHLSESESIIVPTNSQAVEEFRAAFSRGEYKYAIIVFTPLICSFICLFISANNMSYFTVGLAVFFLILTVVAFVYNFKLVKDDMMGIVREKNRKIESDNDKYNPMITKCKEERNKIEKKWKSEDERVSSLLNKAFELNIIPGVHRNLASVYYIYDYMSTSSANLDFTLRSAQIEDAVRRIERMLGEIIIQNREIIFQNRIQEAQNNELIEDNKRMIQRMEQISDNTEEMSYYAKIGAYYSEVNAYFSAITFLKEL